MKPILFIAIICSTLSACNMIAGWNKGGSDSTSMTSVDSSNAYVPVRDESITAQNAYSDLFLDSAALENFITQHRIADTAARDIRNFYRARNYQYAWFASDGPTEQGRGFWNLFTDSASYRNHPQSTVNRGSDSLRSRMDTLLTNDSLHLTQDSSLVQTELGITQRFIDFAKSNWDINDRAAIYYFVPAKKQTALALADSILNNQKDSALYANNQTYMQLRQQLATYTKIAKNGAWPMVTNPGTLRKRASSPAIATLKKRLQLTNDYTGTDTTSVYNDSLATAIRSAQKRFGLKESGTVDDSLITRLNVPVEKRIEQIILNMNRAALMPNTTDSNYIQVNIPSFMLYTYGNDSQSMEMPVIVGKEGSGTTMFTSHINEVVFSPYWNIPESITRDEIMPKTKDNPKYLEKNHIEVVKQNGSIPQLRQLPGKDNPLGKAKFLFPNTYAIYLHDTPDKSLFAQNERTFSHGCIRVANAQQLAAYVLRNQPDWNQQRIRQAMNSNKEQRVPVTQSVPVHITYYTAWMDKEGKMNFRDDIYGHDDRTGKMLFSQS